MNENVLVIGYKGTDFVNSQGSRVKTCKVTYIPSFKAKDELSNGYLPIQIKLEEDIRNSLKEVPGIYKPVYTMVPGANNMPKATLTGLEFVKGADLNSLFK